MKPWKVSWEGAFIGFARAADAAEAIRIMQAEHPHIGAGEWAATEIPEPPPSEG